MQVFWKGFEKKGIASDNAGFKRHVIVLYWDESNREVKTLVNKVRMRFPTVKVKTLNGLKEPEKVKTHKVSSFPTVLLLRNGREVDRLVGHKSNISRTLLEQLFRKANT